MSSYNSFNNRLLTLPLHCYVFTFFVLSFLEGPGWSKSICFHGVWSQGPSEIDSRWKWKFSRWRCQCYFWRNIFTIPKTSTSKMDPNPDFIADSGSSKALVKVLWLKIRIRTWFQASAGRKPARITNLRWGVDFLPSVNLRGEAEGECFAPWSQSQIRKKHLIDPRKWIAFRTTSLNS